MYLTKPEDQLFVSYAIYGTVAYTDNLYFSGAGNALAFPNVAHNATNFTFSQWQASGQDRGGSLADPQFVNFADRNFELRPGSPLHAMGFVPIDAAAAGPR